MTMFNADHTPTREAYRVPTQADGADVREGWIMALQYLRARADYWEAAAPNMEAMRLPKREIRHAKRRAEMYRESANALAMQIGGDRK